jgi:hypothetical protein
MRLLRVTYVAALFVVIMVAGLSMMRDRSTSETMPLSTFVAGRWQGESRETREGKTCWIRSQLEVIQPSRLIYNQTSECYGRLPKLDFYNLLFQYRLVEQSHMLINSRLIDEFDLSRDGGYLEVSNSSFIPMGRYTRLHSVEWPAIAVVLAVLMLGPFVLGNHDTRSRLLTSQRAHSLPPFKDRIVFRLGLTVLVGGVGILIGTELWALWSFGLIRLPWDAVILLEVNIGIMILGIRAIGANPILSRSQNIPLQVGYYAGVVLLGISSWGIFLGLLRLGTYMFLGGSYGFGA